MIEILDQESSYKEKMEYNDENIPDDQLKMETSVTKAGELCESRAGLGDIADPATTAKQYEEPEVSYWKEIADLYLVRLHTNPDGSTELLPSEAHQLEVTDLDTTAAEVEPQDGDPWKQVFLPLSKPRVNTKDASVSADLSSCTNVGDGSDQAQGTATAPPEQPKKSHTKKKVKSHKDKRAAMSMSHDVEGFKGTEDLEALLLYIEGDGKKPAVGQAKAKKPKTKKEAVH